MNGWIDVLSKRGLGRMVGYMFWEGGFGVNGWMDDFRGWVLGEWLDG